MKNSEVHQMYEPVQWRLRTLHKSLTWAHMSRECGICATTIKSFAHGLTRRPQFRTVVLLADYAKFRIQLSDITYLNDKVIKLRRTK